MKYFVIADSIRVEGFKAMGVDGVAIATAEEGDKALAAALENLKVGTILLDAEIYERNGKKISAHERTGRYPAVLKL